MRYDLAALVPGRKGHAVLPAILPTVAGEAAYLKLLRSVLRTLFQQVRVYILPQALDEIKRARAMAADVDPESFDNLRRLGEAMANRALKGLLPVLGDEGKRHTRGFLQRARSSLGVDLSVVVKETDLEDVLRTVATQNAGLIKGLSDEMVKRIQHDVTSAVLQGQSRDQLSKRLVELAKFGDSRARLIASDQMGKLNASLNQFRHEQAGVEKYTWRTARDERVRSRHRRLDGQIFAYGEPTPAEQGLPPGQPIRCRCQALAIVEW